MVRPRDTEGVVAAVHAARAHDLPLTVRSGGHGTAFTALRSGALALDLSGLDHVRVDPAAGTADVGPGATSLAVAEALAGTGWSFPVGHKGDVALGGFLLAGGNGWNQGDWGSACESVLSAEVVLADGSVTRIDAASGDAFAALRGAGPAFPAVVTGYRLRLHREPVLRARTVGFRADTSPALAEVGAWLDALAARVRPEVELTVVLGTGASGTEAVVRATAFGRDAAHADDLLATLDDDVPERATTYVRTTTTIPALLRGDTAPPGLATVAQQAWTRAGYADVLPLLAGPMASAPSSRSTVLVSSASYRRSAPPATEPLHRPLGTLTVAAYAVWEAGDGDGSAAAWPTATTEALAGLVTGHYVGEADLRRTPGRLVRCWAPGGLARLAAVRSRLDPEGRFLPPPGDLLPSAATRFRPPAAHPVGAAAPGPVPEELTA